MRTRFAPTGLVATGLAATGLAATGLVLIVGALSIPARSEMASVDAWTDVTAESGVEAALGVSYVHAGAWGDVDGNGFPDLYAGTFVTGPTQVPNKLLFGDGNVFVDSGEAAISARAAGAVFADFDGDGDLDLFVSNNAKPGESGPPGRANALLRNDGGTMVDVTAGSGIEAQNGHGRQPAVFDHDGDGDLDLFVVADRLNGSGPTVLLRNDGALTFTDITTSAGLPDDVHGLGVAVADVSGDGWPDIFVAGGPVADDNRNYLFVANRDGTYRDATPASIDWNSYEHGAEDWVSSGSFGDIDRDGDLDLLVGHHFGSSAQQGIGAPLRLYRNEGIDSLGNPRFVDITEAVGLPPILSKAPHADIADLDNDGWPDLYTSVTVAVDGGAVPLVFRHEGIVDGLPTFSWSSLEGLHYYPGGPLGDYNRDGRLDVFLNEFRSVYLNGPNDQGVVPSLLLRNDNAGGHWLDVVVDEPTHGVGWHVAAYEAGGAGDPTRLLGADEIALGYGFSSSGEANVHLGLGQTTVVDVVATPPRAGAPIVMTAVDADRRLVITPDAPSDDGLVAHWPFDEGVGSVAHDVVGSWDGSLVDGATWVSGVSGDGVGFDRTAARVQLPAAALDGRNDLSLSLWFRTQSTRSQRLVAGLGANPDEFEIGIQRGNKITVSTGEGTTRLGARYSGLADGSWHNLVVVRDGNADTLAIWIDGQRIKRRSRVLNPIDVSDLVLGQDKTGPDGALRSKNAFDGGIDDLRLYDRALSDDEVLALFRS